MHVSPASRARAGLASLLAASALASGCASNTYTIPSAELQRLATLPPEARGQRVRVVQELSDADVGPLQPVTSETQVVVFPPLTPFDGPERRRGGSGWGSGANVGNLNVSARGGSAKGGGGGMHLGGGGDGKGLAIVVLVLAATGLIVVTSIEGARFDGYAQLHPMQRVYLFGRDGSHAVMPLAWLDPQSAAFADHAIVRSNEGPWRELGRAPLDRQGLTYGMLGGVGTYQSGDGSKALGTATAIQLGYFPTQQVGVVGTIFFGWRDNAAGATLFESRYTAELQAYPVVVGRLHLGLYGGGGAAYRWDDRIPGGDGGGRALLGGSMFQLDINTRIALTARLGVTRAHGEQMSEALFGLSVY